MWFQECGGPSVRMIEHRSSVGISTARSPAHASTRRRRAEVGDGTVEDCNENGVPDECEEDVCPGDVNNDWAIDPLDSGFILARFGCVRPGDGEVVGVLPHSLWEREVGHGGLTKLHLVETMHERKALMADLSDGFVALPGGAGTLDEAFEVWTWAQLGIHDKPCGLLNIHGYFGALLAYLKHAVAERFLKSEHLNMLMVDTEPTSLLDRFAAYQVPNVPSWLDAAGRGSERMEGARERIGLGG